MKPAKANAWTVKGPEGRIWIWCCGPTKSEVVRRVEQAHHEVWRHFYKLGHRIVRVTIQEQKKAGTK